jgi:hypothetical protein
VSTARIDAFPAMPDRGQDSALLRYSLGHRRRGEQRRSSGRERDERISQATVEETERLTEAS